MPANFVMMPGIQMIPNPELTMGKTGALGLALERLAQGAMGGLQKRRQRQEIMQDLQALSQYNQYQNQLSNALAAQQTAQGVPDMSGTTLPAYPAYQPFPQLQSALGQQVAMQGMAGNMFMSPLDRATMQYRQAQTQALQAKGEAEPVTRTIGDELYQWNPQAKKWESTGISAAKTAVPPSKIVDGELYERNPETGKWESTGIKATKEEVPPSKVVGDVLYERNPKTGKWESTGVKASTAATAPPSKVISEKLYERNPQTGKWEFTGIEAGKEITVQEKQKVATGFRKEFNTLSGDYRKIRDSYARIEAAAKDPSAAGDLAIIFNYMKILDPGSVVRESEFATAENAAGVPDKIRNMWNKALTGERIAFNRQDFLNTARKLYQAQQQNQQALINRYTKLSNKFNIDPQDVVTETTKFGDGSNIPQIRTDADWDKLPIGTQFLDPNGVLRVK